MRSTVADLSDEALALQVRLRRITAELQAAIDDAAAICDDASDTLHSVRGERGTHAGRAPTDAAPREART